MRFTLLGLVQGNTMKGFLPKTLILASLVMLSSCRIGTAVFDGGDVISTSGTRDCLQGRTCEFQVSDTNFTETFTAVPQVGYSFVKWRAGENHICGDSTNPVCVVSNRGSEGIAAIEAVIASDEMFYLVPEFECILESCPKVLLDAVLLDLQDQALIVEDYVQLNGGYPVTPHSFGLNTAYRPQPSLISDISVRPVILYQGEPVYLVATVYKSLWNGSGNPNFSEVAYFSLSGSTNSDNSMTWECIPGNGSFTGTSPPFEYLPIECRGW
jgi:hypothetical protein